MRYYIRERRARYPDDRTTHALADALGILPAALLAPRHVTRRCCGVDISVACGV
jgi:hypothetical protein